MRVEPIFKPKDYIINRVSGDMAIVRGIKKNYYQFEAYYGAMFGELNDVKNLNYDLQVNYQKFYDICTEEEKTKLDNIIKEKGGT